MTSSRLACCMLAFTADGRCMMCLPSADMEAGM
jgi:hypothetical protein